MRFAGQAVRNAGRQGRMGMPNFRAQSGSIGDFSARPTVQGLASSMNKMRDVNAGGFTKSAEPTHGKAPVVMPEFNEPIFSA